MKTANPLLVSLSEVGFQLSLPEKDIIALIRDGDLIAVKVRGQVLVVYESLTAFTRRAKRDKAVRQVAPKVGCSEGKET
jgi:dihydroxyacid dehydratase/phosphogluconate dehydratase